ncbi:Excinuclease ABC subunit C [Candidatus Terasakiella magnetica]|uniref:Excinuclease ABC subunit C n=1 Tax=Candidatus Terasakiella magnetica TaxID=1867952 RepID=A0A1C3RES3_9PROT|nr:GIY-YIG nuclease family protein [Candidatus Terasakiella magnetica]SCA55759.1 Excinuclease ABC subunit C [Candidatus Terasakiella magnetica]
MTKEKRWFVYVLLNKRGEAYTGVTYDTSPTRRLEEHNGKRAGGAKYTRARGPWELIYAECGFTDRSAAQSREAAIKKDRDFKARLKTTGCWPAPA